MRAPLAGWGRLTRRDHVPVALQRRASAAAHVAASTLPGVPHANGRSYGDQALNAGGTAWLTRGLDRLIAFDRTTGRLRCEAGVTLAEIIAVTLPHGWFLPVTPGTQFATVGGAIANDVHGKNHHRCGTFGEHVSALTLLRTDGRTIVCGAAAEPGWFGATVGGMGLTGVILDATLQLRRVPGPWIETRTEVFESLDGFFALAGRHAADAEYSVAWVDCAHGRPGGLRGAFFCGDHAASTAPLPPAPTRSARWLPPLRWVRPTTTRAFNALYFGRCAAKAAAGGSALQSYAAYFYPLDGLLGWNRLYGRAGFYQYQCVVPAQHQRDATDELLRAVAASGNASFLNVLKTFGPRTAPGLLSFPIAGTTLAIDFANRGADTLRLFDRLDAIVGAAGGRLYPAKDAAMSAAMFRRGYPRLDEFLPFRDPGISSEMSRRLLGN